MSRSIKINQEVPAITGQQEQAIALLLAGKSQADTALAVEVAPETVTRWLRGDAAFVAAYNTRRLELWEANSARLRELSGKAIDTIEAILQDPGESAAVRLRAAVVVLKELGANDKPGGATTPGEVAGEWKYSEMLARLSSGL